MKAITRFRPWPPASLRTSAVLTLLLIFPLRAAAQQPMSTEDELYSFVLGIEGKSHDDRGAFIKAQLQKSGVGYFTTPFTTTSVKRGDTTIITGENIIATVGHGRKKIVVGAHYDAVPGSPGANDNGSGVAVLLELAKSLKEKEWRYSVDFCFFDREEDGLFGSSNYIERFSNRMTHLAMINLDVEGTGQEVYVGPTGEGDDNLILPIVRRAAEFTKFPFKEREYFPDSDYESFARVRLENISISIVPTGDADKLSEMAKNGMKADPDKMPKVLRVMHTPNDRSTEVTPGALRMSFEFTREVLTLLNDSRR